MAAPLDEELLHAPGPYSGPSECGWKRGTERRRRAGRRAQLGKETGSALADGLTLGNGTGDRTGCERNRYSFLTKTLYTRGILMEDNFVDVLFRRAFPARPSSIFASKFSSE